MADHRGITLACFGLVGTLIADAGIVERAFAEAIATQGVVTGTSAYARCMAQVHRARGQPPTDVLSALFPDNRARAQAARLAYDRSLAGMAARTQATAIPGGRSVLEELSGRDCMVCIVTGLPRPLVTAFLEQAGLRDLVDVALTDDDAPRGSPFPDLILAAMLRARVGDVREAAVIQATAAGVESGRRAGAGLVAGVLTGPHPAARLRAAGATHVLDSIADLPGLLSSANVLTGADQPSQAEQGGGAARRAHSRVPASAAISPPHQMPLERRRSRR